MTAVEEGDRREASLRKEVLLPTPMLLRPYYQMPGTQMRHSATVCATEMGYDATAALYGPTTSLGGDRY